MAFITFFFYFWDVYFYLLIRRPSFQGSGFFFCPVGGQPGRAGMALAWGRCHREKEAALAAHRNFGEVLESRQNSPASGCKAPG